MRHKNLIVKVIVFLMITAILTAGLIACGGAADVTSSVGGTTIIPDDNPTNDSPEEPIDEDINEDGTWYIGETRGKEFYGSSYRGIHVPGLSPSPWVRVSYNDTNRLDRLWKAMIDGWKKDGNRRLYIKSWDGDFFFDADYNVRWTKQPDVVLKYFQGGIIVQLLSGKGNSGSLPDPGNDYDARGGEPWDGFLYLGGLYTYGIDGRWEATKYNSDTLNVFMGVKSRVTHYSYWNLYRGRMEIMVLHRNITVNGETGKFFPYRDWKSTGYGLQVYMDDVDAGFANGNKDLYNLKGNTPERYFPTLAEGGAHNLYKCGLRWMYDKTYNPNTFSDSTTESKKNNIVTPIPRW